MGRLQTLERNQVSRVGGLPRIEAVHTKRVEGSLGDNKEVRSGHLGGKITRGQQYLDDILFQDHVVSQQKRVGETQYWS